METPETVRRLQAVPSIQAAYQLHKNAATSDADNTDPSLIANKTPEGGEFIHLTVAPDGSKYAVKIGVEGRPQPFDSR